MTDATKLLQECYDYINGYGASWGKTDLLERLKDYLASPAPRLFRPSPRAVAEAVRETRRVYKNSMDEWRDYLNARFKDSNVGYRFKWEGKEWRYKHSDFDEFGDFDLLIGAAPAEPKAAPQDDSAQCFPAGRAADSPAGAAPEQPEGMPEEKWQQALEQRPQSCACLFEWRPTPDFSGTPPVQLDECGFHAEQRRALREDAESYRWLRDNGGFPLDLDSTYKGNLDAAIDAARKEGKR